MSAQRVILPRPFPWSVGVPLVGAVFTYIVFPLSVQAFAKRRTRPRPPTGGALPTMTVVIPACNEEVFIAEKVRNTFDNGYDPALLEVIVVNDGSTDSTVSRASAAGAKVINIDPRGGKCNAISSGVAVATGDIVVVTDANGLLNQGALRRVGEAFADPEVMLASGAKAPTGRSVHGIGEAIYWKLEVGVRQALGELGCLDGADGAVYAFRREWFRPIPAGVLNDDFYLTLVALDEGHRVVHAPNALAEEQVSATMAQEFRRRSRVSAGIWQGSVRFARLASPLRGRVAYVFIGHRILRSMVMPCLLPILAVASVVHRRNPWVRSLLAAQLGVYGAAAVGVATGNVALAIPTHFTLLNVAALRGLVSFVRGNQHVAWERIPRVAPPNATWAHGHPGDTSNAAPTLRAPSEEPASPIKTARAS